jgi:branched-subunit amino acid aminotransferase/4-amino-4-deoxychorismate lyase
MEESAILAQAGQAMQRLELNGGPASPDDLFALASTNYGHFTSMQVREARVQGLDLHIERLQAGTRELFGCELDAGRLRDWLRGPGSTQPALSLRVTVFSRGFDRDRPERVVAPDVLVATGPARAGAARPLRLAPVRCRREAPHLKHVGTFGLFHARRQARLAGFDDALLVGDDGEVLEGSVWNVGFFDGGRIVWPEAPALPGVAMQLIERGLRVCGVASARRRITLADVGAFRSAFLSNGTCAMQPLAAIGDVAFAADADLAALLERALATEPWQAL